MSGALFDAHCDTAFQLLLNGGELWERAGHFDLRRGAAFAPHARFFALFPMTGDETPVHFPSLDGLTLAQTAERQLALLTEQFARNTDRVSLCRSTADAGRAFAAGRLAAFLSLEGAEGVDCTEAGLRRCYDWGVRMVNPVWNRDNALCGSCATGTERGLSARGRAFVRLAERLGMLVDVSHMSERGFWDLCETIEGPFVASHSNARALCDHPRNLTDAQFRALCRRGGVAGLNLCADFLGGERATVDDAVRHLEHFLALGGEDHLAIGTDFDGCDRLPEGIAGIQDLELLRDALRRRGLTDDTIEKIFFQNLYRLVGDVCDI